MSAHDKTFGDLSRRHSAESVHSLHRVRSGVRQAGVDGECELSIVVTLVRLDLISKA